jgi:hypothetical protein
MLAPGKSDRTGYPPARPLANASGSVGAQPVQGSYVTCRWLLAGFGLVAGAVRVRVAVGVLGLGFQRFQPRHKRFIEPHARGAQGDEQSPDDRPVFGVDAVTVGTGDDVQGGEEQRPRVADLIGTLLVDVGGARSVSSLGSCMICSG